MPSFCHKPAARKAPQQKQRNRPAPSLEHAYGRVINDGKTIDWSQGGNATELTEREINAIKRETGCKTVKVWRALIIKNNLHTKTIPQLADMLGCCERTVWGIRDALLKAGVGEK